MKSCPTCNRTFGDEMVFCLVDGSILGPPFDPQATQGLRAAEPASDTVLLGPRETAPTIASPAAPSPQAGTGSNESPTLALPRSKIAAKPAYLIGLFGLVILVGLGMWVFRPSRCATISVNCQSLPGDSFCHVERDSPERKLSFSDPSRSVCSIAAMALQQRTFTDEMKINWSVSAGRITQKMDSDETIRIDVSGLQGQRVTATATVEGLGWFCANSASDTFLVSIVSSPTK
ncbi:MAG: hypothetical protein ABIP75_20460 [Pyrinomonadaceae bacterium]